MSTASSLPPHPLFGCRQQFHPPLFPILATNTFTPPPPLLYRCYQRLHLPPSLAIVPLRPSTSVPRRISNHQLGKPDEEPSARACLARVRPLRGRGDSCIKTFQPHQYHHDNIVKGVFFVLLILVTDGHTLRFSLFTVLTEVPGIYDAIGTVSVENIKPV